MKEFVASIFRSADPFFTGKASHERGRHAGARARAHRPRARGAAAECRRTAEYRRRESDRISIESAAAKATFEKSIELAERLRAARRGRRSPRRAYGSANIARGNGEFDQARDFCTIRPCRCCEASATHADACWQRRSWSSRNSGPTTATSTPLSHRVRRLSPLSVPRSDPGNSETILARRNFGLILVLAKRFDDARPLAEQAFRDSQALHAFGRTQRAAGGNRSRCLRACCSTAGAISTRCIALLELGDRSVDEVVGPKGDALLPLLNMLARAHARNGDMNAAIAAAQRAYDITTERACSHRDC